MAIIGTAHLHVVPTFDGLTGAVKNAFGSVDAGAAGKAMGQQTGQQFSVGLSAASGAVMGVFSQIAQRAMGAVTSHIDSAVSRVDILHNYPLVMQSLGVAADEADASIQTMSDRLQNLPTRLDSMASTVQGLYAATERYGVSLGTATEAGLALNNMLLAGGGNQQIVNSAMEQFRQMLSKGKPDMQDWKSLLSAAPGQMNQLAHAMLGATATTQDLYYALGGGKDTDEHMEGIEFASISVNELLDAIIRLNGEGSEEFSSFSEQAEEATGGIGTAMANMENAITRGIADVVDTIGRENIVGVINDIKGGIRDAFEAASEIVSRAMPYLQQFYGLIKENGVEIAGFAAKAGALIVVGGRLGEAVGGFVNGFKEGIGAAKGASTALAGLSSSAVLPATLAFTALAAVVGTCIGAYIDNQEHARRLKGATTDLADAVSRATALEDYSATLDDVGISASYARVNVDEMVSSVGKHAEAIASIMDSTEEEIATLNTAQEYIDLYAGKTDLTSTQQGKLQWAIDKVNESLGTNITLEEAITGEYTDQEGEVHDLKESLGELIETRKAEARAAALSDAMTEAYAAQRDAAKALATAEAEYAEARAEVVATHPDWTEEQIEATMLAGKYSELRENLADAQASYGATEDAVASLEEELGIATAAASGTASDWEAWASSASQLFRDRLGAQSNKTITDLIQDLENAGYSAADFADLTESELAELAGAYDEYGRLSRSKVDGIISKHKEWVDAASKDVALNIDTSQADTKLSQVIQKFSGASITMYANVRANSMTPMPNAAGGYRLHADGAIATRAVPLDIVGEAGAEAIVPLTNRKYAQPFIDMLSEGIAKTSASPSITYNISIDGNALASDSRLMGAFEGFMREVARKADM